MHKCTVVGHRKLSSWKQCYQECNSNCVTACMDPAHKVDAPMLRQAFADGAELHDMLTDKKLVLEDDLRARVA